MRKILICETTREEREQIVAESLDALEAACEGGAPNAAAMYQAYIDGEKELRDINREYNARYVAGMQGMERGGCGWAR
ncbi:MAG: purine biosynthesis protein PurH [Clostridia bacterium]|nr:purine biosynthesis protein PurH [Clostridia bacterium]